MKRLSIQFIVFWIMIALAALGIVLNLFTTEFLIPVIVVAVVFLLYKFPPSRYSKNQRPKVKPSKKTAAKMAAKSNTRKSSSASSKKKQYPFQVIEGQKGKNDPPDDTPKYH